MCVISPGCVEAISLIHVFAPVSSEVICKPLKATLGPGRSVLTTRAAVEELGVETQGCVAPPQVSLNTYVSPSALWAEPLGKKREHGCVHFRISRIGVVDDRTKSPGAAGSTFLITMIVPVSGSLVYSSMLRPRAACASAAI